ncbi:MAG TPA: response regulator [Bryobacteraceae bacterium]|nr:response regulator [Bryobacteraceae bacterium]
MHPGVVFSRKAGFPQSGSACGAATRASTAESPICRAARIWVVEDNPGDVYLLEKALKHEGLAYELTCFEDGSQAIRALSRKDYAIPDLILVDLKLPRLDGFEVLRSIHSQPALVGVPVGVLTSSDAESDRHRVILQGVDGYILKPEDLDEFLELVGKAIKQMLSGR